MSNFLEAAYDPERKVVRRATWIDDHFGRHQYGVQFDRGGPVYRPADVTIPIDVVFVPGPTISQWADRERQLSPESSAGPGLWNSHYAEYQRGIMDAISDPEEPA